MGDRNRNTRLQMGAHASAQSLTVPSLVDVEPMSAFEDVADYAPIERDLERPDGKNYSALNGYKVAEINGLQVPVFGLGSGGAGSATSTSALHTGIETDILTMLMGGAESDYTGEATPGASPGAIDSVNADGSVTDIAAGAMVAVEGATSGLLHVRFVENVVSTSISTYPQFKQRDNSTEIPAVSSTIYAMKTWALDESVGDVIPLAADVEGPNHRRQYINGTGSFSLQLPAGGYASLSGALEFSDWQDVAEANGSFSQATYGGHVRMLDAPLYIGDDIYMARDMSLDLGAAFEDRTSDGAPNGRFGRVLTRSQPVMSATLHAGTLTAPLEVTDSVLATLQGDQSSAKTTQGVFLQVGRQAGAMMGIYMPAAEVRARRVRNGGQYAIQATFHATRHATLASLYIGIG